LEIKNVTETEIRTAVQKVNDMYEDNIHVFVERLNHYQSVGARFRVNLRVFNANKKHGTVKGRKLNQAYLMGYKCFASTGSACWHVHGFFFEKLLELNANAVIVTKYGKIDKNGGNWVDRNIGSIMQPLMYSEACECSEFINTELCVDTNNVFLHHPLEVTENTQITQKIFTDYDALDALAKESGFEVKEDENLSGWVATIGDSCHNPIAMLKEAMEKLKSAQARHKDAILGFCQTGNFSIGYTVYVKQ
jgi:heterodisulfide reductase subunit B